MTKWTKQDAIFEQQQALKAGNEESAAAWSALIDHLIDASFVDSEFTYVIYKCNVCGELIVDIEEADALEYICPVCLVDEENDDFYESPEFETDPYLNYNEQVGCRDAEAKEHESTSRFTPCDTGDCPFGAVGGYDCRNYCGLGVDEDSPDYEDDDDDDDDDSDYSQNAPCDNTGVCAGMSCSRYYQCQA